MKYRLFLFLFFFIQGSFSIELFGQDIITKLNGDEIQAKILEVNPTEIKYKKFDLQDGPLFIIKKSEVFMIKYSNGDKEVISQKSTQPKDTTLKNGNVTTVKVTYSSIGKDKDVPEYWSAIKVNPLLSLVGEFPIYFEYALKTKSSVELGLGPTFPNGFSGGILNSYINTLDSRTKKMGYSISLNYRFYPSVVFDEFFFGLDFRYRAYLTEYSRCGQQTYQNKNETLSHTDGKLLIGYMTEIGNNALVEYYVAFGIRNIVFDYYECTTNSSIDILSNQREKEMLPTLSMGVKIGFGLVVPKK